jgi:hypothetical protein
MHSPTVQSALVAQGSPIAPVLHVPPELFTAQLRPLWHWSGAEQGLLAPPLVHEPWLEPGLLLPQNPLWHC